MNKQIRALKDAAQAKHKKAMARVTKALQKMEENSMPINFGSVAKFSGVAKSWLYRQPQLREKIEQLRDRSGTMRHSANLSEQLHKQKIIIKQLKAKLSARDKKIATLTAQLEVAYGKIYTAQNS